MLAIPSALQAQFEEYLRNRAIPNNLQGAYKKWLRYYLDFCQKYNFPPIHKESLPHFIRKLQEKKQTKVQQEQAVMAITLYYEVLNAKVLPNKEPMPQPIIPPRYAPFNDEKHFSIREATAIPIQYEKVIPPLSRDSATSSSVHRSSHTVSPSGKVDVERGWVQKFQTFTRGKIPELLSSNDVKEFLTFLAVKQSANPLESFYVAINFHYLHSRNKVIKNQLSLEG